MTPVEMAALIKDYGMTGFCGLLMGVIVFLFKKLAACQEDRIADAKVSTEAITRQNSINTDIASSIAANREGQTEIMKIVSLIQRDIETDDERLREKLADLTKAVDRSCRGTSP